MACQLVLPQAYPKCTFSIDFTILQCDGPTLPHLTNLLSYLLLASGIHIKTVVAGVAGCILDGQVVLDPDGQAWADSPAKGVMVGSRDDVIFS